MFAVKAIVMTGAADVPFRIQKQKEFKNNDNETRKRREDQTTYY